MTPLDQRIDDLLGDAVQPSPAEDSTAPVFVEMSEGTASVIVEGLRWALYGGKPPPGGRRSLLILLDALTTALAERPATCCSAPPDVAQDTRSTL